MNTKLLSLTTMFTLLLFVNCSGKVKIEPKPVDVNVNAPSDIHFGPNFEAAAAFCDERYGVQTVQAEECFDDYRKYTKPELSFNLDSIQEFCEDNYVEPNDIQGCVEDLSNIIFNSEQEQV